MIKGEVGASICLVPFKTTLKLKLVKLPATHKLKMINSKGNILKK